LIRGRGVSAASRSSSSTGIEEQLRRPVRPPVPQIEDHLPLRRQLHEWKHVIDEMRRALGHPPAAAARTDCRALSTDILDFRARVLAIQFGKAQSIDER
jgi:hypothetical protein